MTATIARPAAPHQDSRAPLPPCAAVAERPRVLRSQCRGGIEELSLDRSQCGADRTPPVLGGRQSAAAIELAVGSSHRIPGGGRGAEVSHDPLTLDVIREPLFQPRPLACECFVRELHRLLIGREQPRVDQLIEDPCMGVVDRDPGALHPASYHRTVSGGLDETEEDVAQQPLAVRRERGEHLLRGLRDGTVDLTGCPIRLDGQNAALTT